ncbi:unnamed protein product [Darwinula stevensoni]|uniref:Uncharacterized protein n=1 Tax=Darwinula stevensoni TaxID=69355 RepID=A0A7R8X8G9_9CRUS|nr:unnamed protein product [Darwinula stevensoni]CAG0883350.1 unnamed protein product [Darwinula stevensoni]
MFARDKEIRGVDINMPLYHIIPPISSSSHDVQLDFDAKTKTIYWTDNLQKEIRCSGLSNVSSDVIIDVSVLGQPSGLAVDWISRLLYISSNDSLLVSSLKGEYLSFLMKGTGTELSSLALNPEEGKLFWIQRQNSAWSVVKAQGDDGIKTLRVYDADLQQGSNPCVTHGGCSHLCLPISKTAHVCKCADGFLASGHNGSQCAGHDPFLMYSVDSEIAGLNLEKNSSNMVLMPPSGVSSATSLDFHAEKGYIYWADNEQGRISRVRRDGTNREVVIQGVESGIEGLAVDWIAGNLYWTNSKLNLIMVAHLNGSSQMVIATGNAPSAIAVHPSKGLIFWSSRSPSSSPSNLQQNVTKFSLSYGIIRAHMDGTDQSTIHNSTAADISIDYEVRHRLA